MRWPWVQPNVIARLQFPCLGPTIATTVERMLGRCPDRHAGRQSQFDHGRVSLELPQDPSQGQRTIRVKLTARHHPIAGIAISLIILECLNRFWTIPALDRRASREAGETQRLAKNEIIRPQDQFGPKATRGRSFDQGKFQPGRDTGMDVAVDNSAACCRNSEDERSTRNSASVKGRNKA